MGRERFSARYDVKVAAEETFREYRRFLAAHARAATAAARPAATPERPAVAPGRPAHGAGTGSGASAATATAIVLDGQAGEWRP